VRQFCIFEGYTVTFQMKEVNDSSLEKDKEVLLLDPIDFIKTSEEDKVRFQEESKKIDVFREYCLNSEPSQENIISPWITLEENKKNQQRFIDQYGENKVYRELNKSYVGFSAEGNKEIISTGSGGCGIYGGNPQLKFVMQWIATSVNNKKMAYNVREELNEYFKDVEEIRKKYVGKSVNLLLKDLLENCEKIQEINSRPNYDNNQNVKAINNLLFGLLLEKKDVVS